MMNFGDLSGTDIKMMLTGFFVMKIIRQHENGSIRTS